MKQQSEKVFCQLKCMYKFYKVICVCKPYFFQVGGIFIMYVNLMQLPIHVDKFFVNMIFSVCCMVSMGMWTVMLGIMINFGSCHSNYQHLTVGEFKIILNVKIFSIIEPLFENCW